MASGYFLFQGVVCLIETAVPKWQHPVRVTSVCLVNDPRILTPFLLQQAQLENKLGVWPSLAV